MNIYYNLPHIGNLMMEHEFYSFGSDPILFVCKDKDNLRYLCSCCHIGDEWVVGQVSEENLIRLIDDRMSIRKVFETCDPLLFVVWNGEDFCLEFDIPDEAFPQAGAFLEMDEEKTGTYRETLKRDVKPKNADQEMITVYQAVLPHIQQATPYIKYVSQALLSTAPMLQEISKCLSMMGTAQIQKISEAVTQHIGLSQSPQFDNFPLESISVMIPVTNDNIAYEKICENDEIDRYAV